MGLLALTLVLAACGSAEEAAAPAPDGAGSPLGRPEPSPLPPELITEHPRLSPNAKVESHLLVLDDRRSEPHPSDGGGRAWLVRVSPIGESAGTPGWQAEKDPSGPERPELRAASTHRFEIVFEVGAEGIAEGGVLFLSPDPFWSWSEAHSGDPRTSGHVTARPRAEDVELVPSEWGDAAFTVRGRALRPGERIDLVYGAGAAGARVDAYAERGSEILIGVDGDGDGFRSWLARGPLVDIVAREPATLVVFGPAEVTPGAAFELNVASIDARGNRAPWPEASARPRFEIEVLAAPTPSTGSHRASPLVRGTRLREAPRAGDSPRIQLVAPDAPGTLRLAVRGVGDLGSLGEVRVPPIVVRSATRRLVWGDLHGHSAFSDGTGSPADYFAYARDVAALDAVALTDHDHWGVRGLDDHPTRWDEILATASRFHDPGRFVTLPGYEWTSWLHGHRHVLYFDEKASLLSAFDAESDRPDELWAALRGTGALTFAHHSAGEPVATNWAYPPDPTLEPVIEISSVHGTSEAGDAPGVVQGALRGFFARDELLRGSRLGFIGSGDSHDGHPGLAHHAAGHGGLAGLFVETLDRAGLRDALTRRHTFATNGIRPFLEVHLDETPMGGILPDAGDPATEPRTLRLWIRYEGTAPIARVDLIRALGTVSLDPEALAFEDSQRSSLDHRREIPQLLPGEFHYVRIEQTDGGLAWSSPIFAPRSVSQPDSTAR